MRCSCANVAGDGDHYRGLWLSRSVLLTPQKMRDKLLLSVRKQTRPITRSLPLLRFSTLLCFSTLSHLKNNPIEWLRKKGKGVIWPITVMCERTQSCQKWTRSRRPLGVKTIPKPAAHGSLRKKDPAGLWYIPLEHINPPTHTPTCKWQSHREQIYFFTGLLYNSTNKLHAFKWSDSYRKESLLWVQTKMARAKPDIKNKPPSQIPNWTKMSHSRSTFSVLHQVTDNSCYIVQKCLETQSQFWLW